MTDPATFTTQISVKLSELRMLLAPAQIQDYPGAIKKCAEISLLAALAKETLERMDLANRKAA